MKVLKTMVVILIIINYVFSINQNIVQASSIQEDVDGFEAVLPDESDNIPISDLQEIAGRVLGVLRVLSGLVTIVLIAFTGYKFMTATPSVQHELKTRMVPMIFGLVILFGATIITSFFLKALQN